MTDRLPCKTDKYTHVTVKHVSNDCGSGKIEPVWGSGQRGLLEEVVFHRDKEKQELLKWESRAGNERAV